MKWGKILQYFDFQDVNDKWKFTLLRNLPPLLKAEALVGRVYGENKDKSGNAETFHFYSVSQHATTEEGKIVGWLHDIVEDGYIDLGDLILLGFSPFIVNTIQLLSHDKKKYPKYEDYITSIIESGNPVAIEVKYYDICNNIGPKRMLLLSQARQEKAIKKWCKQLLRIADAYENINKQENDQRRRKLV